ncbi:hypothetical protein ACJX0J_025492, partial [Zea mays]
YILGEMKSWKLFYNAMFMMMMLNKEGINIQQYKLLVMMIFMEDDCRLSVGISLFGMGLDGSLFGADANKQARISQEAWMDSFCILCKKKVQSFALIRDLYLRDLLGDGFIHISGLFGWILNEGN